jgi:hypothetical protein
MRAIALMMQAASTSETSVDFYQTTRRYNLEDSHLHISGRENLKSHLQILVAKAPRYCIFMSFIINSAFRQILLG